MDQHLDTASEVTYHHEPVEGTKHIWKTFWLLLIITVIELALGFLMYATDFPSWIDLFLKGVIIILSLAKAFYIVGIFMHLGDEIRNMIMTIVVPLFLFVWFIAAFLWDGSSYRALRNKYNQNLTPLTPQGEGPVIRDVRSQDTAIRPLD